MATRFSTTLDRPRMHVTSRDSGTNRDALNRRKRSMKARLLDRPSYVRANGNVPRVCPAIDCEKLQNFEGP